MDRAYLEMRRTLHGIRELLGAETLRWKAKESVGGWLAELRDFSSAPEHHTFDTWHRGACEELSNLYARGNYPQFTVGQGQKWLNMTLKYVYIFGEHRLPGFGDVYDLCHAPLDRAILDRLALEGVPSLSCRSIWSRLNRYDEYRGLQQRIREKVPDSAPLAVEIRLWQQQH